jgi:hypothetical protein
MAGGIIGREAGKSAAADSVPVFKNALEMTRALEYPGTRVSRFPSPNKVICVQYEPHPFRRAAGALSNPPKRQLNINPLSGSVNRRSDAEKPSKPRQKLLHQLFCGNLLRIFGFAGDQKRHDDIIRPLE